MSTQNSLVCHQLPINQSCKYQVNKRLPPTFYDFTYHISAVFETAPKCVYIRNFWVYILVAACQLSHHCFTVSIKTLYVLLKFHKLNTIMQSTSQNAIFQEGNKQHQPSFLGIISHVFKQKWYKTL